MVDERPAMVDERRPTDPAAVPAPVPAPVPAAVPAQAPPRDGSPTVRRRRLGLILRGLRERQGLTGEQVGAELERSGSWVSRVETGRVGLRTRDLSDLLDVFRVTDP